MLILILIDVKYLQNVVFTFEKGSNGQNNSCLSTHHPIKKSPQENYPFPPSGGIPLSLNAIWTILDDTLSCLVWCNIADSNCESAAERMTLNIQCGCLFFWNVSWLSHPKYLLIVFCWDSSLAKHLLNCHSYYSSDYGNITGFRKCIYIQGEKINILIKIKGFWTLHNINYCLLPTNTKNIKTLDIRWLWFLSFCHRLQNNFMPPW